MKILLCSPIPSLNPKFGAARVALDFASGLKEIGIDYDLYPRPDQQIERFAYAAHLREYLPKVAHRYDVVDYPFDAQPWIEAANGATNSLNVARCMLLPHHQDFRPDPKPANSLCRRLRHMVRLAMMRKRPPLYSPEIRRAMDANIQEADLTNVANSADRECLVRLGFDQRRICVFPYGLTSKGFAWFEAMKTVENGSDGPIIAFVGTFDHRKGCLDFPEIVRRVVDVLPSARFRLLGTKGMMVTKRRVLEAFPNCLRSHLDVYPSFEPEELPHHLSDCSLGIFPSYREGFGIAVVEMLAAGLPVAAYDAPGPCDILPKAWLHPPGDVSGLAETVIQLIRRGGSSNPELREQALVLASRFHWREIASRTMEFYQERLSEKRDSHRTNDTL